MPSIYNKNIKKNINKKLSSLASSSYVKIATDTLLIVESPAKCSTILKYLGPGYRCIATMGHMRYLDGLDSIDVKNNYKLTFIIFVFHVYIIPYCITFVKLKRPQVNEVFVFYIPLK